MTYLHRRYVRWHSKSTDNSGSCRVFSVIILCILYNGVNVWQTTKFHQKLWISVNECVISNKNVRYFPASPVRTHYSCKLKPKGLNLFFQSPNGYLKAGSIIITFLYTAPPTVLNDCYVEKKHKPKHCSFQANSFVMHTHQWDVWQPSPNT